MKTKPLALTTLFATSILLTVAGCATKRGEVARQWSLMMREQQIAPIFPPREDIRVGDVYLTHDDPNTNSSAQKFTGGEDRDFLEIPLLFYRTNLEASLITEYRKRSPYPLTPTNILVSTVTQGTNAGDTNLVSITNVVAVSSAEEAHDPNIFQPAAPDRLRHVGFPEFSFAKISKANLQAVVPVEGMNVALAASIANAKDGYVKISSGESISLPFDEVYTPVFAGLCGIGPDGSGTNHLDAKWSGYINQLAKGGDGKKSTNSFYLTIINEVFYARTIDVGFTAKKTSGAGVNAAGSPSTNAVDMAGAAQQRADQLNIMNVAQLAQKTPGGSLTYTAASDFGIGLRRTYTRPMAVGYRGVVVKLEKDGTNWTMGAMSVSKGVTPAALPQ